MSSPFGVAEYQHSLRLVRRAIHAEVSMRRIHALCFAAVLLLGIRVEVCAQSEQRLIRGTVTDSAGVAVPYVNVRVGRDLRVTDDSGRFSVALKDRKAAKLEFRRIGYHPTDLQLVAGDDTTLAVALIPTAQLLSPAVVKVREQMVKLERVGFYRRMTDREKGINTGHFITAEEIEKRGFPHRFTILLDQIPSVGIRRRRGLMVPTGTGGCVMTTYLDGARLVAYSEQRLSSGTGFYTGGGGGLADPPGGGLDDMIRTSSVAGVEVYSRGNAAPPQYQALNGSCGVILIWTR
jgi:hypothetical protein